ncbi:hypothetical protein OQZ33_02440 [Pedobacter sp. MC2016-05]|uniref:hypothetical protein n=1 Tax=Pedobacter sp. MC2016-05 TaxID=2994474 RepID=UPI002247496A|nr:hypothetical protein [Pedobacter sp. MC2016-05]MCX2473182.1 hypothetical protein [Pedobacter sp. MC2016-05]
MGKLIFLTGCINPDGMSFTKLQNPAVRKQQYIDAINFYLNETDTPILFVENSGTDISKEFDLLNLQGRLELLTFDGNNFNKNLGKGFGEMQILKYAITHSTLYSSCEHILKITGRYKVLNINSFLTETTFLDSELIKLDIIRSLTICESKFWICKKEFLSLFLLDYHDKLNDSEGYYFEHALLHATFDSIKKGFRYGTLVEYPRFSGVFGTDNTKFNDSYLVWAKQNLRFKLKNHLLKN